MDKVMSIKQIYFSLLRKSSLIMLGFLAIFYVFLIFYILYLLGLNSPEKYIPIITASVALYTPFGAYKLAEKWKEQKKFETFRDQSLKILEDINQVHHDAIFLSNIVKELEESINNRFINLSEVTLAQIKAVEFRGKISKVWMNLDIYLYMLSDEDKKNIIRQSFRDIAFFSSAAHQIQQDLYVCYAQEIQILKDCIPENTNRIEFNQSIDFFPDYLNHGITKLEEKKLIHNFIKDRKSYEFHQQDNNVFSNFVYKDTPKNMINGLKKRINPFKSHILENSGLNKL